MIPDTCGSCGSVAMLFLLKALFDEHTAGVEHKHVSNAELNIISFNNTAYIVCENYLMR